MQFQVRLLGQRGLFIKKESTKLVTWLERSVPQMLPQIPSPSSSSGFLCRCLLDQQSGQGRQAREEEEATWVTQWYKTRKNALPTDPRPLCCACSEWSGAELCSLALQRGGKREKGESLEGNSPQVRRGKDDEDDDRNSIFISREKKRGHIAVSKVFPTFSLSHTFLGIIGGTLFYLLSSYPLFEYCHQASIQRVFVIIFSCLSGPVCCVR